MPALTCLDAPVGLDVFFFLVSFSLFLGLFTRLLCFPYAPSSATPPPRVSRSLCVCVCVCVCTFVCLSAGIWRRLFFFPRGGLRARRPGCTEVLFFFFCVPDHAFQGPPPELARQSGWSLALVSPLWICLSGTAPPTGGSALAAAAAGRRPPSSPPASLRPARAAVDLGPGWPGHHRHSHRHPPPPSPIS